MQLQELLPRLSCCEWPDSYLAVIVWCFGVYELCVCVVLVSSALTLLAYRLQAYLG